jgi:hypothetical protein
MFYRKMLTFAISVVGVVFAVSICIGLSGSIAMADYGCPDNDHLFTTDFQLNKCRFVPWGNNPYFKLWPGYQLVLEGEEDGEFIRAVVTVLWDKEVIDLRDEGIGRVRTRVVEEREWVSEDGEEWELEEVSRNFFARCKQTDAVYYFGEDVDNYEDGEIVNHDGAWRAGENGAMPGLIMPGTFLLGSKYFQEIAVEDEAVDRGENTAMGLTVTTEAGTFENCVEVVDTNPAEGVCEVEEGDVKIYAPGIGLVMDEELELVDYGFYVFDLDEDEE